MVFLKISQIFTFNQFIIMTTCKILFANLLTGVTFLTELLFKPVAILFRLFLFGLGAGLVYLGVTGCIPSMVYQMPTVVEQIFFMILMIVSIIAGILIAIKTIISSDEDLLEPYF